VRGLATAFQNDCKDGPVFTLEQIKRLPKDF
jgi:hypothetical protein